MSNRYGTTQVRKGSHPFYTGSHRLDLLLLFSFYFIFRESLSNVVSTEYFFFFFVFVLGVERKTYLSGSEFSSFNYDCLPVH